MVNLVKYCREEWNEVSETLHKVIFNEFRPKEMSRIDFVLGIWDHDGMVGYVTCREMDSKTIYIGFGGIFPEFQGSGKTKEAIKIGVEALSQKYETALTLIKNNNVKMLKLAMDAGFFVTGIKVSGNDILLEHSINWGDK